MHICLLFPLPNRRTVCLPKLCSTLQEQAWPRIADWVHRRAASIAGPAPGAAAALPLLLRWVVAARLAQLRRMQQQWQAAQEVAPAPPEPVQQQALLCELEAGAALMQLSQDANGAAGCADIAPQLPEHQPAKRQLEQAGACAQDLQLEHPPAAKRQRRLPPLPRTRGTLAAC